MLFDVSSVKILVLISRCDTMFEVFTLLALLYLGDVSLHPVAMTVTRRAITTAVIHTINHLVYAINSEV